MKHILISLVLLGICPLSEASLAVPAQVLPDLYTVILKKTTPNASQADYKTALQQMYNRLKPGDIDTENPVIISADPRPLIQSSRYHKGELAIHFKPDALHKLLHDAGQQPWLVRPKILTFVSIAVNGKALFFAPEDAPERYASIAKAAAERHMDIVYAPRRQMLGITSEYRSHLDIQRPATEGLAEYARPFHPEAILLIRFADGVNPTIERWEVFYKNKTGSGRDFHQGPPEEAGKFSMARCSRFIFKQGESTHPTAQPLYVNIGNIRTVHQVNETDTYLKNIPGVLRARVNSVTEDAVLYTLDSTVSPSLLHRRLAKKYDALPSDPEEGIMNYRIKP